MAEAVREMKTAAMGLLTGADAEKPAPTSITSWALCPDRKPFSRLPLLPRIHARRHPNVINKSDVQGLYLDTASMSNLKSHFASGELRVRRRHHQHQRSAIIRDAVARLCCTRTSPSGRHVHHPPLRRLHPRSGLLPAVFHLCDARRRHLVLDERVLNGLKETTTPGVPSAPPFRPSRP